MKKDHQRRRGLFGGLAPVDTFPREADPEIHPPLTPRTPVSTPHCAAWASGSDVRKAAKPAPEPRSAYPKHGLITMKSPRKMPGGWVID